MAKSKSGGTRSYIRGRVGSDVYSIGKNAKGKKQQVVRSLAETVANPQTIAQMRGRMIMSTIMQAQSALKPIIDHSFDNVVGVQPNLSEFIRRNYALIKADVAANPSSGNAFGLNAYQEKGVKQGAYIISDGKAAIPAAVSIDKAAGVITIALSANTMTMGGLKAALNFGNEDFLTIVGIDLAGAAEYCRYHVNQSLADDTAISSGNIDSVFETEGNATPVVAVAGNAITITLAAIAGSCGFIVTRKVSDGFIHSKATLGAGTNLSWNADAALPTYPVGENKFLNGGDQSFSPAPAPTPSVGAPTINGVTPFETSTSVSMSAESGAEIHYTVDGTTPNASSPRYSAPFTLNATTTVKAIAIKDGATSSVANKTFTKSSTPVVNAPSISGTTPFETSTQVTMSADSGAEIRYTTNGSKPTASSSLYSSPITLNATTTVKAIAIKNGVTSSVASQTFTKQSQPVAGRSFTANGAAVNEGGSVSEPASQAVAVVATLPSGDPSIGKRLGIRKNGDQFSSISGSNLAAGENSGTINQTYMTPGATIEVGWLFIDDMGDNRWEGTFFTINVAAASNDDEPGGSDH